MLTDETSLSELVWEGTLEALRAFATAYPDDALLGFALMTDDDISGLFHIGCTASFASANECPDVQFVPNDWTQAASPEPQHLEQASELLQRHSRQGTFGEQRLRADFNAIVDGFGRAVAGHLPETFLTFGSTDPGPLLERLEEAAILTLNSGLVVANWMNWRVEEAKLWLVRLQEKPAPLSYRDEWQIEELRNEIARFEELLADSGWARDD